MFKVQRSSLVVWLSLSVLAIVPAVPGAADSDLSATADASVSGAEDAAAANDAEAADALSVQDSPSGTTAVSGPLSKLSVHGFLTQAYADAKFVDIPVVPLPDPPFGPGGMGPIGPSPTGNEASIGIPEDGTTNYRFLALQFRYDVSDKDVLVVQLSSRALGFSGIQDFEDEVELDWAFYEHKFSTDTSIKVGRVQIPFGIYNEVRDVGTVLPFYRPAFVRYKEGNFTSETVDGLSIDHTFFADSDWNLDLTAYAGEWKAIQFSPGGDETASGIVPAENAYGAQLWLNTPLPDVRFGVGLISFEEGETTIALKSQERRDIYHASLDATFGKFTFQVEWDHEKTEIINNGLPAEVETTNWVVDVGFQVTEKLRFWAQGEQAGKYRLSSDLFLNDLRWNVRRDLGLSVNYFFSPNLVLKAEHHWVEEDLFTFFPDFSTGTFLLRPVTATADGGRYTIIALSVAF